MTGLSALPCCLLNLLSVILIWIWILVEDGLLLFTNHGLRLNIKGSLRGTTVYMIERETDKVEDKFVERIILHKYIKYIRFFVTV